MDQERHTAPPLEGITGRRTVDIELSDSCELDCVGCFTERGHQVKRDMERLGIPTNLLTLKDITTIAQHAKRLGYESVYTCGNGEPTIDRKRFWRFVDIVNNEGLTPGLVTHGLWATTQDAQRLLENNVTVLSKLWSLEESVSRALMRDHLNRPYRTLHGAQLPEGIANIVETYTQKTVIEKYGHKLGLNTIIHAKTAPGVLDILAWDRKNKVIPYMEFIFASGSALSEPELWFDGKGGATLYEEPFTERNERARIFNEIIEKDRELGFTYPVPENPSGKVGQDCFDNSRSLIINAYGYVVSCPAMADVVRDEQGRALHATTDLERILKGDYKCGETCSIGGYTCIADRYNREQHPVLISITPTRREP
jgi:hypothetical protein